MRAVVIQTALHHKAAPTHLPPCPGLRRPGWGSLALAVHRWAATSIWSPVLCILFPAIPVPSFPGSQGLILSSLVDRKSPDRGQAGWGWGGPDPRFWALEGPTRVLSWM